MPWVGHFWAEFDQQELIYQTGSTPPTSGRYNVQTIVFSHGHADFPVLCFGSCCGVTVDQAGFPVLCFGSGCGVTVDPGVSVPTLLLVFTTNNTSGHL